MATKFRYLYVIPNTIPPYGYEFVNILCLPQGFTGRFRFNEKWVSDEFKANYKEYFKKPIHILLRDKATATILPLRKALVDHISKIGDTYLIKYTLAEYFLYDSKETVREEQITKYCEGFFRYHTDLKNNTPNVDMSPLVFGSSYDCELVNNHFDTQEMIYKELESFRNIIEKIKNMAFFDKVTFTKIISLIDKNTGEIPPVIKGKYRVKEETDYELSIYQSSPTLNPNENIAPNDIEIKADDKYISIIKGKQRAVGKYDIINLLLRTNINTARVSTFIDVVYSLKPGAESHIDPNISLPILITTRFRSIITRLFILLVSIAIYMYAYIVKSIKTVPLDILKDVSIIAAAVVIFDLKSKLIEYYKRK